MNLDEKVQYTIHKSRKRKTIRIKVSVSGSVEVYAPLWCRDQVIAEVVENKQDWIRRKLEEYREYAPRTIHTYEDGDMFSLFGEPRELRIAAGSRTGVLFENGFLILTIPQSHIEDVDPSLYRRKALVKWYREESKHYLQTRIHYWETIHPELRSDTASGDITVRMMKRRWGSCDNRGNLKFNIQVICAPKKFIDCIIIHELCHRRVFHHRREFTDLVESYIPDYRRYMDMMTKETGAWNI